MGMIATAVKHMIAAGMDMDSIVGAIEEMENAPAPRSAGAIRQERYRRNKASQSVTRDACDAGDGPLPPEQKVPTPLKTQPLSHNPPSPPKGGSDPQPERDDLAASAFEAYNLAASEAGWPKAAKLNPARKASLLARLSECGGLGGWREALQRARGSAFLTGDSRSGWLPNIDFFLQASSFTKLIEGAYDRNKPRGAAANQPPRDGGRANPMVAAFVAEAARFDDRRMEGWGGDTGTDFGEGPILDLQPVGSSRSPLHG